MVKNIGIWKFGFGICSGFGILMLGFIPMIIGIGCGQTTETPATTTTSTTSTTGTAGTTTTTSTTSTTGATGTTTTTSTTSTTGATGTATISGQVAAASSDLVGAGVSSLSIVKPMFRTLANTGVSGCAVTLYKIAADGTETATGKSATTDSSGNYTISGVAPLSSGVYKVVAEKTVGSNTVQVKSLTVITTPAAETVNIAPETSIAASMFDDIIKDEYSGSLVVNQNTIKELKNLVTDDTENLVNQNKLALPSMKTNNAFQIEMAAAGIGENNGNAEKASKKLELENLANTAKENSNLNQASKYMNEVVLNGSGANYLIPKQANQALGQAFLDGRNKTVAEIITAADNSATGPALNSNQIIAAFNNKLQDIKTKYNNLTAGTSPEAALNEPEYIVFDAVNPPIVTSAATLDVAESIALKNFIETSQNVNVDDVLFIDNLGFTSGTSISTNEAFFDDVDIYYWSGGGWKLNGFAKIYLPPSLSGVTVTTVEVYKQNGSLQTVLVPESGGNNRYQVVSENNTPTIEVGSTSTVTNRFTLKATLSNATTIETPVTLEAVSIPGPTLYKINGTMIDDSNAETSPGSGVFSYYALPSVSELRPIFYWSTAEVASVSIPAGYSWAHEVEITVYGTQTGAATLELDSNNKNINLTDAQKAAMEYNSRGDLSKTYTNNSFISPMDFLDEISGQKVGYRFYLQRVLLNAEGKYNGIAAGAFRYLRYAP